MRRFFLCPIVGSGTFDDPYRALVHDLGSRSHDAVIPSRADGHPAASWTVAAVDAEEAETLPPHPHAVRLPRAEETVTEKQRADLHAFYERHRVAHAVRPDHLGRDLARELAARLDPAAAAQFAEENR